MPRGRPRKAQWVMGLERTGIPGPIPCIEPEVLGRALASPPEQWSEAAKGLWLGLARAIPRSRTCGITRREFETVVRQIAKLRMDSQEDSRLWRIISKALNGWGMSTDSPLFAVLPAGMDRRSKFFDLMGRDPGGPTRLPIHGYFPECRK
jgi:hypothetical protein